MRLQSSPSPVVAAITAIGGIVAALVTAYAFQQREANRLERLESDLILFLAKKSSSGAIAALIRVLIDRLGTEPAEGVRLVEYLHKIEHDALLRRMTELTRIVQTKKLLTPEDEETLKKLGQELMKSITGRPKE